MVFIVSYCVGSISFAYILTRILFKADLRKKGSGNLGAANSMNVGGIKIFILVFVLDFLKGYLTLFVLSKFTDIPYIEYAAALGIILGHNYSIFLRFSGGKGLASLVGITFFTDTYLLIVALVIAGIICAVTRRPNISAAITALLYPFLNLAFSRDIIIFILSILLVIPVIVKHKRDFIYLRDD